MGAICGCLQPDSAMNRPEAQSITDQQSSTQEVGLSAGAGNSNSAKKNLSRRNTSNKGMTRLSMKFPHIRYSFKECKKVFDACCGDDRQSITKSEVKPLLVQLGANATQLTDDEISRIVKIANLDGDDVINFKEFLIAAAVGCFLNEAITDENVNEQSAEFKKLRKGFVVAEQAFHHIDEDKSGVIDFEELKHAFSTMKSDNLINERLKELDFNGDKSIEFPEFVWGITAWVGMDPDGDDLELSMTDFDDENTQKNVGDALSPKHRLSIDGSPNPNNPTDDGDGGGDE